MLAIKSWFLWWISGGKLCPSCGKAQGEPRGIISRGNTIMLGRGWLGYCNDPWHVDEWEETRQGKEHRKRIEERHLLQQK